MKLTFDDLADIKHTVLRRAATITDPRQRIRVLDSLDMELTDFEENNPGVCFRRVELTQMRLDAKRQVRRGRA